MMIWWYRESQAQAGWFLFFFTENGKNDRLSFFFFFWEEFVSSKIAQITFLAFVPAGRGRRSENVVVLHQQRHDRVRHVRRYAVHVPGLPPLAAVVQHLNKSQLVGYDNNQCAIESHVIPRGIHRGRQSVPCRYWLFAGRSPGRSWRCGPSIRPASGAVGARNGRPGRHSSRSNRWKCRCEGQNRGQTAANAIWIIINKYLETFQFQKKQPNSYNLLSPRSLS